ncbi:hypothetical protein T4B_10078 [Trichinella pseudospiralis]|uniref:Uncharacterized protein n=1 Tax=Trichinella pseudospiralis TaxID=6337 RepID=A0A0V1JIW6_TRIPS|nr:hypothetical protein T4B_10078 [Trichinella pseudospiralis]KRZ44055.1 hypothetical protein T4C_10620 [Trichinella pseudospiralis]
MAGLQEGDAPFVNEKLNGTSWTESSMRVSVLLDTGSVVSVERHLSLSGIAPSEREPLKSEKGTILVVDGRRMCTSGVDVVPLQLGRCRGRVRREASFWSETGDRRGDERKCSENADEKARPNERERTSTEQRRTNWRGSGGRSSGPTRRVATLRTTSQSLKIFKN